MTTQEETDKHIAVMTKMGREMYMNDPIYGSHPNSVLALLKEKDYPKYRLCLKWLDANKNDLWAINQWGNDGFISRSRSRNED